LQLLWAKRFEYLQRMAESYKCIESEAPRSEFAVQADSADKRGSRGFLACLIPTLAILGACQTTPPQRNWDVPLTLQTVGPAYADYALEKADTNKDKKITEVEWISAGGTARSFSLIDQNKDGVITRTELIQIGSNARFLDMSRRYVDFNKDNQLTPRDFRSPAGIRVLRLDF